ncbi:hypothetical protein EYV94_20695 [Puteibacter caeruleilacunae]|nr:hypothetical protein EYV94_20695 [Puteibacter caeruleilacunae]
MKDLDMQYRPLPIPKEFKDYEMREITVLHKVKVPSFLHDAVIAPIWDMIAGEGKGAELFVIENITAFDNDGNIKDYSRLKLTAGDLYMPNPIVFEEDNKGGITIYMDADDDNIALMKKDPERKLDRICYVLIQGDQFYSSFNYKDTREDLATYLTHPIDNPKNMHVFVFFCDKEMKHFSPAEYQMMFEEE